MPLNEHEQSLLSDIAEASNGPNVDTVPSTCPNYDQDTRSEIEKVARSTGHTVAEVIMHNALTTPSQTEQK